MSDGSSNLLSDALQYLLTGGAGILGRGMHHVYLIQQGRRKSWFWIACDLMIALGMGWVVLGLGDTVGLSFKATQSLAIMMGWAGPQIIDVLITRTLDKYFAPAGLSDEDLTPKP